MSASSPQSFFPGMGDAPTDNPMLSGMALMRQVWGGLSGAGQLAQGLPLSPTLDPQDLARRIDELRTVENWLNLNLSLLRSTIQGLEVQRATINTLQNFFGGPAAPATPPATPFAGAEPVPAPQTAAAEPPENTAAAPGPAGQTEPGTDPAVQAAQAWWSLLQQQFQGFAAAATAATASAPQADSATKEADASAGAESATVPPARSAPRKAAAARPAVKRPAAAKAANKANPRTRNS